MVQVDSGASDISFLAYEERRCMYTIDRHDCSIIPFGAGGGGGELKRALQKPSLQQHEATIYR